MDIFDIVLGRNGSGGGGSGGGNTLVATATYDDATFTYTLDKTWQELHDAAFSVVVVPKNGNNVYAYINVMPWEEDGTYGFDCCTMEYDMFYFRCNAADDYPAYTSGD